MACNRCNLHRIMVLFNKQEAKRKQQISTKTVDIEGEMKVDTPVVEEQTADMEVMETSASTRRRRSRKLVEEKNETEVPIENKVEVENMSNSDIVEE